MEIVKSDKWLCLLLIAFLPFGSRTALGADTTLTEVQIALGLDYAKSGLTKEAKQILIPLLHDEREPNLDSKVRYFLGAICFFLDSNKDCASYHWERILLEEPNTPEAEIVRGFMRNELFISTKLKSYVLEDWSFKDDINTARLLWSPLFPDYKMEMTDLRDSSLAMPYYDMLLEKYKDPAKKAKLLFEQFYILAGYNNEHFGYLAFKNSLRGDTLGIQRAKYYLKECNSISDSLGKFPEGTDYYVHSQFLLGVMTSGTKFLSTKIKLNETSVVHFENVVRATQGQDTNLFRIFAQVWLDRYYEKQKK